MTSKPICMFKGSGADFKSRTSYGGSRCQEEAAVRETNVT